MYSIFPENDWRNYLMHHGVKGQKWGVQNGPPYPLDAGNHSASEKKAGWRDSLKSKSKISNKEYSKALDNVFESNGYDRVKFSHETGENCYEKNLNNLGATIQVLTRSKKHSFNVNGKKYVFDRTSLDEAEEMAKAGNAFSSNYKKYETTIKNAIVNDLKSYGGIPDGVSSKSLKDGLKLDFIDVVDRNHVYVTFYDEAGNIGYHFASVSFDVNKKKCGKDVSIEG